ncbi:MAG: sulfatase-like hydrolase/transferase [Candidatus Mcinerneyibacterium aminivorans]|uniref:Sulfatase-like hydrolase/transferase n=1 Tax=Candidatus Mcinerneyibacterium aminivorans TaxID=2703815 RepID=A0A5D0MBN0_9BACT|nr:MAG: sulfatase-like hydrolase/transferase [Candidatus Mcinerneyibacterium aminivorans]
MTSKKWYKIGFIYTVFLSIIHSLLHYFYLLEIIDIDKGGDWFDLAVYPLGLSLFLIFSYLYKSKFTLKYIIPPFLLIIVFILASHYYYEYFETILNIPLFIELIQSINLGSIIHVIGVYGPILFLFLFLFLGFIYISLKIAKHAEQKRKINWKIYLLIILLLFVQPVRNIFDPARSLDDKYHQAKTRIVVNAGLPFYLIYDYMKVSNVDYGTPDLDIINSRKNKNKILKFKNNTKIKNVFFIQVESLAESVINRKINNKEIVPFFNKLAKESIYFPNFFANHIVGSADADFSVLTSILPNSNQLSYNFSLLHVKSLVNVLNHSNFNTVGFHPVRGSFFNREQAFNYLGFNKYYHYLDYENKGRGWFAKDSAFLNQSIPYLKKELSNNEKNFFYIITMQAHGPFRNHSFNLLDEKELNDIAAKYENKDSVLDSLHYFNSIYETDLAVRKFMDKMKNMGLYNNSIFFIFGDHSPEIETNELFDPRNHYPGNIENTPLFILFPRKNFSRKMNSYAEHIDLAPTLTDILNIKKSKYWLGENIFTKNKFIVLNNLDGFYLKKNLIYMKEKGIFIKSKQKFKSLSGKKSEELNNIINNFIEFSNEWFYNSGN